MKKLLLKSLPAWVSLKKPEKESSFEFWATHLLISIPQKATKPKVEGVDVNKRTVTTHSYSLL